MASQRCISAAERGGVRTSVLDDGEDGWWEEDSGTVQRQATPQRHHLAVHLLQALVYLPRPAEIAVQDCCAGG